MIIYNYCGFPIFYFVLTTSMCHDIAEILLKVALSTKNQIKKIKSICDINLNLITQTKIVSNQMCSIEERIFMKILKQFNFL
jgi:hypothetical protein